MTPRLISSLYIFCGLSKRTSRKLASLGQTLRTMPILGSSVSSLRLWATISRTWEEEGAESLSMATFMAALLML